MTRQTRPDVVTVGVDGVTSDEAVHWAIEWALAHGAPIEFVHALPAPPRAGPVAPDDRRRAGLQLLEHELALAHKAGLTRVGVSLADQPVAAALVGASHRAGLLVIGRRDTAARIYRRSPSVSRHLSRYSACPVVVVPQTEHAQADHRIVLLLDGAQADEAALNFALRQASATGAEIDMICGSPDGSPERAVLSAADHAELIVLPAPLPTDDMLSPTEPELVGLRHAPCPVVYAR
jgi:nucleotide-binding universal stress UspA family protein